MIEEKPEHQGGNTIHQEHQERNSDEDLEYEEDAPN